MYESHHLMRFDQEALALIGALARKSTPGPSPRRPLQEATADSRAEQNPSQQVLFFLALSISPMVVYTSMNDLVFMRRILADVYTKECAAHSAQMAYAVLQNFIALPGTAISGNGTRHCSVWQAVATQAMPDQSDVTHILRLCDVFIAIAG